MRQGSVSRRGILFGQWADPEPEAKPYVSPAPWWIEGETLCTACGECVEVCPENFLKMNGEDRPVGRLGEAECITCGDCVKVCKPQAINPEAVTLAFPHAMAIGKDCLALNGTLCRICDDACETRAIRFRPKLGGRVEPVLDQTSCTGCGACLLTCPQNAISIEVIDQSTSQDVVNVAQGGAS